MTKTFLNDILASQSHPAEAYISSKDEAKNEVVDMEKVVKTPNQIEITNKKEELKSVRLNLLLKPSIKQSLNKLARFDNTSINDLINKVLEEYTNSRKDDIAKIDALRS